MNLARHTIFSTKPLHIFDARFDADCEIFTVSTLSGFAIYQTWPLKLLRKHDITGGTLALLVPMQTSSLLFLVGGGRSPLYPPNKVVLWDDNLHTEVAELEFRERVRGLTCRRDWLAVSLRRRVVIFQIGKTIARYAEYDTCDNPRGLMAMATGTYSTLLAIAGRQVGHVQLIHLPPCRAPSPSGPPPPGKPPPPPPKPSKNPVSIIVAHTSALTTLSVPTSGSLLATTSTKGTLIRIWDTWKGTLVHEFRRGADKAIIYGVAFRPDEQEVCVWSDKGTVHVFALATSSTSNRQSMMSQLKPFIPLPKYFNSEWSYAHYRIPSQTAHISLSATSQRRAPTDDVPDEERCVVGWIPTPTSEVSTSSPQPPTEYQLVALTYAGGWYRLSLPRVIPSQPGAVSSSSKASSSPLQRSDSSSSGVRSDRGKQKELDKEEKESRRCTLEEFRRFGRWDGWG